MAKRTEYAKLRSIFAKLDNDIRKKQEEEKKCVNCKEKENK